MQGEAEKALECKPRGRGKARAQIPLAVAARDRVNGQRQDVKVCSDAAVDHAVRQSAVLVKVQLEEFRRADRATNLFNADGSQGRDAEHGAKFCSGFGDRHLAIMMKQSLKRGRWAD